MTALTVQSVAPIDLAQQLSGHAKLIILNLRYGCPGCTIMQQLLTNADVNPTIPADFHCPICMSEKTISLPRKPTQSTLLLPIGSRLQMDFGLYKVPSRRGFCCFLLVIEACTSYKWTFLPRTKDPPIELCLWFIRLLRGTLGFTIAVIRTDGGGKLSGSTLF
jgi:hypothetical protein